MQKKLIFVVLTSIKIQKGVRCCWLISDCG